MRTIRLSTAYQLFLSALLLGASLGIVSRQLPTTLSLNGVAQAQTTANSAQSLPTAAGAWACCYNGQPFWVNGATPVAANAPVLGWSEQVAKLAHSAAEKLPFTVVEQTRFAEQLTPRLFLFVHAGEEGVADYHVRVHKDGQLLTVTQATYAGIPSYTWPTPHSRQRYANLKVEFPDVAPAGLWTIELVDAQGTMVGAPVHFQIASGDPNLEMYVDYQRS